MLINCYMSRTHLFFFISSHYYDFKATTKMLTSIPFLLLRLFSGFSGGYLLLLYVGQQFKSALLPPKGPLAH